MNVPHSVDSSPLLARVDLGEVPYSDAVDAMRGWVDERRAGRVGDRLFLLSHPGVVTFGRRTEPKDLVGFSALPTVEVDRGGSATYHGPGQLIGYLVRDVRARGGADIVRWLENGLIAGLRSLGFDTIRRETPKGRSSLVGVWTADHRKVASIGMRIRQGVSSHGFALNIDPDMTIFKQFTACALPDVNMTSLQQLASSQGRPAPDDSEVRNAIASALGAK